MKLHEYQGKTILKNEGVQVPFGIVIEKKEEAIEAAKKIQSVTGADTWAIKAQIHAGGRGKGGGVKIAKNLEDVKRHAESILGMNLVTQQTGPGGRIVNKVLIEQGIYYPGENEIKEFYMSILLNRSTNKNNIIYSTEGGMDIEAVAGENPALICKEEIDPFLGIQAFQVRRIAFNLGLSGKAFKQMVNFVTCLYKAYVKSDASLIEINPVFKTSDDLIMAADVKIILDDNGLIRHKDYLGLRDYTEEDPEEVVAGKFGLNFIKLDGNVGCMVNGAGLAMATMDIIKLSGSEPANFLDVGGTASDETVEAGFRIILKDTAVKAILINIFGGIVRCDRVAKGVVEAYHSVGNINIPVIVRLQGTNADKGKKIIDDSGLKVYSAITLQEAANLVKSLVG